MKLMTVKQYAESVNLPVSSVRAMCKNGELPAAKFGVAWRIDSEKANLALEDKMNRHKVINNGTMMPKPKLKGGFLERLKAL